ncbi:MAG: hypothetical protein AAGA60_03305 [Cyanobacteria bacterium P01_E01_bin.42]
MFEPKELLDVQSEETRLELGKHPQHPQLGYLFSIDTSTFQGAIVDAN